MLLDERDDVGAPRIVDQDLHATIVG